MSFAALITLVQAVSERAVLVSYPDDESPVSLTPVIAVIFFLGTESLLKGGVFYALFRIFGGQSDIFRTIAALVLTGLSTLLMVQPLRLVAFAIDSDEWLLVVFVANVVPAFVIQPWVLIRLHRLSTMRGVLASLSSILVLGLSSTALMSQVPQYQTLVMRFAAPHTAEGQDVMSCFERPPFGKPPPQALWNLGQIRLIDVKDTAGPWSISLHPTPDEVLVAARAISDCLAAKRPRHKRASRLLSRSAAMVEGLKSMANYVVTLEPPIELREVNRYLTLSIAFLNARNALYGEIGWLKADESIGNHKAP